MRRHDRESHPQLGFSLVELMIAMAVTLIITGAVFKLVTAGQTAFRREPALADRQQNIRVAMDVISQDLYRAGYGLPQFAQTFTDGLDGVGPAGSTGADTDELEIFAATECPPLKVCDVNGSSLTTYEDLSACYNLPSLVILANDTEWYPYWAEKPGPGASSSCAASGGGGSSGGGKSGGRGGSSGSGGSGGGSAHDSNGHVVFPPGQSDYNNPGGPNHQFTNPPEWMLVGEVIRYRIRIDADGTPNLERSPFGGSDYPDGTSSWQIVARGVEDLQVQYLNGAGWQNGPGTITCGLNCAAPTAADYDKIIRRVRVRLSARALEANLQGQTTSAVGNAVRGQLATEIAPRPAAATLGLRQGEL
jgi:prepilin-type N-terminal cleavage/methylation domain-containing protein